MQVEPLREERVVFAKEITMNMNHRPKQPPLQNLSALSSRQGKNDLLTTLIFPQNRSKIIGATTYTKDSGCEIPGGRVVSKGGAATPVQTDQDPST